jgi:2-oxoglutarate ferredoxin oxidoreductase subunit beta
MLEWYKAQSVTITRAKDMSSEALRNKIVVGEFVDIEKPELIETLTAIRDKVMAGA